MKLKELKLKTDGELNLDLAALQEQTREMRFKNAAQELKNNREISVARKTIARIHTILKERSLKAK